MDQATARQNIRELVDLLADQRTWFSSGDAAKIHETTGMIKVYDTALPQPWYDRFYDQVGEAPAGIVWCYDNSKNFGAPYALTLTAYNKIPDNLRLGGE